MFLNLKGRTLQCMVMEDIQEDLKPFDGHIPHWLAAKADTTVTGCSWDGSVAYFANVPSILSKTAYVLDDPPPSKAGKSRSVVRILKYLKRGFNISAPMPWLDTRDYYNQFMGDMFTLKLTTQAPPTLKIVEVSSSGGSSSRGEWPKALVLGLGALTAGISVVAALAMSSSA